MSYPEGLSFARISVGCDYNRLRPVMLFCDLLQGEPMLRLLRLFLGLLLRCFDSRRDLLLENLALRQQLSVFQQRKRRPVLSSL
jgi:hypothetical protein